MSIAVKVACRLEVTRTLQSAPGDMNIVNLDVATASLSTEDIIVLSLHCCSTGDVPHDNVLDDDTVRWVAGWSAVQVVLLDINSVDGYVLNANVLEKNIGDEAGSVRVRLDAGSVLSVQNDRVGEGYVGDIVV